MMVTWGDIVEITFERYIETGRPMSKSPNLETHQESRRLKRQERFAIHVEYLLEVMKYELMNEVSDSRYEILYGLCHNGQYGYQVRSYLMDTSIRKVFQSWVIVSEDEEPEDTHRNLLLQIEEDELHSLIGTARVVQGETLF